MELRDLVGARLARFASSHQANSLEELVFPTVASCAPQLISFDVLVRGRGSLKNAGFLMASLPQTLGLEQIRRG